MELQKKKIDSLQLLRAIAFWEIFGGHCGISFFTGAFGVSVFVILSGFCMAIHYLPKADENSLSVSGSVKFALSKVKRLYGLHILMLLVAFYRMEMVVSRSALKRILMNLFLIQSWSPNTADFFSYNAVAWYLSSYLFVCMAAPCIMKLLSKIKSRRIVLFFAVFMYGAMVLLFAAAYRYPLPWGDNYSFWLTYISPISRTMEFSIGAAFGMLYLNRERTPKYEGWGATALEILSVGLFVAGAMVFHKIENRYDGMCCCVMFSPLSVWLVWVFLNSRGLLMKLLDHRPVRWLGDISGYAFLIHQQVLYILMKSLDGKLTGISYRAALLVLTFLITALLSELVKRSGNYLTFISKKSKL